MWHSCIMSSHFLMLMSQWLQYCVIEGWIALEIAKEAMFSRLISTKRNEVVSICFAYQKSI